VSPERALDPDRGPRAPNRFARVRWPARAWAVLTLAAFVPAFASAQDHFSGGWKIETSEPAPWVTKPGMIENDEVRRLVGAAVEIRHVRIDAPAPLGCRAPHYEIKREQAEGLFEGGLGEIADATQSADQIAQKLGFRVRPIPSLVTGCAAEIAYHALDDDHLIFALNNSLYRLKRTHAGIPGKKL